MEEKKANYITAGALLEAGFEHLPDFLTANRHLIYSSPATLAYNSPGAQGFGVKRAGLSIPGSVMLLVSPGCCGRNTTVLSELGGYADRFSYLLLDETDVVTGRHLRKIPRAVRAVCEAREEKPSVVMICITCVDALLGTDMERVCRKASEEAGLPVLPCYMYALTREGRRPPMVHVRQSIYSLLKKRRRKGTAVNLLGYFAPLMDDCELYDILAGLGVKTVREISRCADFEEYLAMAEANFNLVLHPEARAAAADFSKRLSIPSVELSRLYQIDKIRNQYRLFGAAIGAAVDDAPWYAPAENAVARCREAYPELTFSVGEGCNANPFELSLALLRYGFRVEEIFGCPAETDSVYLKKIARLSPDTRLYSNLDPTMLFYGKNALEKAQNPGRHIVVGKDAAYYHPEAVHLAWSDDVQPFGYAGVRHFFEACMERLEMSGQAPEEGEKR